MSRNSQQRRATKQRRDRRRTSRGSGADRPQTGGDRPQNVVSGSAACDCPECLADAALSVERSGSTTDQLAAAESVLVEVVRQVWQRGWQPSEVVRQITRSISPTRAARDLVSLAITAEAAERTSSEAPPEVVDPRWRAQVDTIVARRSAEVARPGWVARWADLVGIDIAMTTYSAVARQIAGLGPLLVLIAPPGSSTEDVARWSVLVGWEVDANAVADPLLEKVRALLAKAEATEFIAEAEAFTAKAHQLMVGNAIDEAAVRGRRDSPRDADVGATRFSLPEPYAKQHMLLLGAVAAAAGARCVFHADWAIATVVGSRHELARIDALYTSLMVQSQTAFNATAADTVAGSRQRSRGFRSSFLTAYADRIGRRLAEQRDVARDAAPRDALPVLAADSAAVDAKYDALFAGSTRPMSVSASDRAGWTAGGDAAARARLSADELRSDSVRPPTP